MNKMTKLAFILKLNEIDWYIRLVLLICTTHLNRADVTEKFLYTKGHSIIKISLYSIIFQN